MTISLILNIDKNYNIFNYDIKTTIIHPIKNYTYENIDYKLIKNLIQIGEQIRKNMNINIEPVTTSKNMIDGEYEVYGGNGINGHHNEYFIESPTIVIDLLINILSLY